MVRRRDSRRATAVRAAGALALLPVLLGAAAGSQPSAAPILFGLAVLVMAARFGGLLVERAGAPPVLGELLVGVGLANVLPALIGGGGIEFVRSDPTLFVLAQIGVLVLLFDVGLEADLRSLARVGSSSVLVALIGTIVPLALGWGVGALLLPDRPTVVHLFVGATLSATSIGISARVLKDLGATQSSEGQIIVGAAVLDDILCLVLLAAMTGAVTAASAGGQELSWTSFAGIVFRAALFLGVTVAIGHYLSNSIVRLAGRRSGIVVIGLGLCFALAYVAERIGLAAIVGAFAAGLMLDPYGVGIRSKEADVTLRELMEPLSALFVPLFFVLMGIQVDVRSIASPAALAFGALLTVCAVAGKLVSGAGVLEPGTSRLAVGIGMVPRGEVGLIFAGIGAGLSLRGEPVLDDAAFSALVLMVLVTTLIAPIGLRLVLARSRGMADEPAGMQATDESPDNE